MISWIVTWADLINSGAVIKGLEKGCFRDHLLINTAGTTEWTKFVKEMENVELARRNTQPVPMDFCRRWAVKIKSYKEAVHGVELTVTWRETVERKLNTCKTTQRVDGLVRTTKPKASPARAEANTIKARAKASLVRAKARARAKERVKQHGKKGKKGLHEMEGHDDKPETQTSQEHAGWTDTTWDHADKWTDADWWSSDWSTDL